MRHPEAIACILCSQIMGLKKLAPYREDQAKQRPNYKALQALRAGGGGSNGGSWPDQQKHHKGGYQRQQQQGKC